MREPLERWREAYQGDHAEACRAAAERIREDPWRVVVEAGALARARVERFDEPVALGARLQRLGPASRRAVAVFQPGEPVPVFDPGGRKRRGAWDTPRAMAERLAQGSEVLDPACGPGVFLLAAQQAGARRVRGWDLDPAALAVARVAVPEAELELCDAFERQERAEVVLCNPPFVAPEHQDKGLRQRLRERFGWLSGRFDLAVPFAAHALAMARRRAGLVLPASLATQRYAASLRRRWLEHHALERFEGPLRFEGAGVDVVLATWAIGQGPAALPWGVHAEELLGLANAPLDQAIQAGDVALVRAMLGRGGRLGDWCEVDTGVVAHGPLGGKERLLHESPGPGRVPYVDARDLRQGRVRWLDYKPAEMHRAKRPELFEQSKILVQRLRGPHPVRAVIDHEGLYAGHTLTVVRPRRPLDLDRLLTLLESPLVEGLLRLVHGARLDLYPNDIRQLPVPPGWLEGHAPSLEAAFDLGAEAEGRLQTLASQRHRL